MTAAIRSRWWEYLLSIVFANKSKVSYYWVQKKELHKKLSDFSVMWKVQTTFNCVFVYRNTKWHNLVKNFPTNFLRLLLYLFIFSISFLSNLFGLSQLGFQNSYLVIFRVWLTFKNFAYPINFSINHIKWKWRALRMLITNNKTKLHKPILYF